MGLVCLEGIEVFAYHGVHLEERKNGNTFFVDVCVETNFELAANDDNLEHTVDYSALGAIVKQEMEIPSNLLEHVGQRIATSILDTISQVINVDITIAKSNPPIGVPCAKSKIAYSKKRE